MWRAPDCPPCWATGYVPWDRCPGEAATSRGVDDHLGVDMEQGTCSTPGCGRPVRARGMCRADYQRWHRAGGAIGYPPVDVRFWSKVNKNGPVQSHAPHLGNCWLWTGGLHATGYGHFRAVSREPMVSSHQWAYRSMNGPVPDGLELDHLCRVRACVRPEHLEPVTHAENMARSRELTTHCPWGHEWTTETTRYNRKGYRYCHACDRQRPARPRRQPIRQA